LAKRSCNLIGQTHDLWQKRVATLLAKLIVILCDFRPFPLLQSKVHVFLQPVVTYILNIDIHQKPVMALKANGDARVKKKACNADIEEEIKGFKYVSYRVVLPRARWCQNTRSLLCCVIFWVVDLCVCVCVCILLLLLLILLSFKVLGSTATNVSLLGFVLM
jgi:hypothetical protein